MTAMAMRHILVTGFEPFAGNTANPSQELAKAMDGRVVADHAVQSLVLPVQHKAAGEIMRGALDAAGLAAVIHLGLATGRARLSLERIAVNVMDYRIPDAQGEVRRDEPCVADGPAAYASTLPLRAILEELTAVGIPPTSRKRRARISVTTRSIRRFTRWLGPAARSPPASSTSRSCPPWSRLAGSRSRAWI